MQIKSNPCWNILGDSLQARSEEEEEEEENFAALCRPSFGGGGEGLNLHSGGQKEKKKSISNEYNKFKMMPTTL